MKFKTLRNAIYGAVAIVAVAFFLVALASIPPKDFKVDTIVSIKPNSSLTQAAQNLKDSKVIKSTFMFKVYAVLLSGHRSVKAGDYKFSEPQSALRVAYRTARGIQGIPKIKVTLYEGMTAVEMSAQIKKSIPKFDSQSFIALAKPYEGTLFPDTYYLYTNVKPADVVKMLRDTFSDKIRPERLNIQAFGKSFDDVIKMASLIEKETNGTTDRRIVADVLWRRIAIGMPLQVDATFYYVLKKDSLSLTRSDLAMDSPYNLYKHTGLPPTPIANPGLETIRDTINPTPTKYLFFLSGKDGKMHYAETLEEHAANKAKYLY